MKKTKRIIFYFTGTGNCLYVARQLGGKDAELLSIPQLMKHKKFKFEADEIGLVYPIYGHMPPNMVRRFIQKAQLKADYRFAVLTYGNRKCSAVEIWDDVSRKAGTKFDYINTIKMVDNWLPNFDINEQLLIDKHIPEKLEEISTGIAEKKHWHEPVSQEEREQHQGFLERSGVNPDTGFILKSEDYFTITNACIGCGACVSVCPHENYKLLSQGVETGGDCDFCFACIQNCPQKSHSVCQERKCSATSQWREESQRTLSQRTRFINGHKAGKQSILSHRAFVIIFRAFACCLLQNKRKQYATPDFFISQPLTYSAKNSLNITESYYICIYENLYFKTAT